jgi:hypothetical protein
METITINNVEYIKKSDLSTLPTVPDDTAPFELGKQYIIRTVTMYFTGRLVWLSDKEMVLEDAAWIADSGRWYDALTGGTSKLKEVEPIGRVIIGRGALIDATEWTGELPTKQK